MSRQNSEEVAFYDVSGYFSKEEWKLLHEWQKQLYRNVMKEIHQALISLGPLIATTVFSLRTKGKEELCPMDNRDSDSRQRIKRSPSDAMDNPVVSLRINKEEQLHQNTPQNSEDLGSPVKTSPFLTRPTGFPFPKTESRFPKEETVPIFIDHLGAEIGEGSGDPNSGHDVISFHINDEEETFCMDHQDSTGLVSMSSPTGDGSIKRVKQEAEPTQRIKKPAPCEASSGKEIMKVQKSSLKGPNCTSQLRSEGVREIKAEKTPQWESLFSHSEHSNLDQGTPNIGMSEKYDECEGDPRNSPLLEGLPNIQQVAIPFTCTECDKSFSEEAEFMRHLGMHSRLRPYECTECGKTFFQKPTLIKHIRTHSGEKPYACTFCQKRFSRKDNLNGHMRIHSGERPYKCPECEKCFTWKGDLNQHRKKAHYPREDLLSQINP